MRSRPDESFAQDHRAVIERLAPQYEQASLAQKGVLLDLVVAVTGYARKYAITLLTHPSKATPALRRPRQPAYGHGVQHALWLAWETTNRICAKRLIPFLPTLVPVLEQYGYVHLSEQHHSQVLTMSAATADRLLQPHRTPAASTHSLSLTQAGPLLKDQIPLRLFHQWDDARPSFLEADLVAHCGNSVQGNFLYTLTLTDVATGWTECLPLLFRSPEAVQAAIEQARALFPFPILGIDTDNGKEFINETILEYCQREQLTFTRGRPNVFTLVGRLPFC